MEIVKISKYLHVSFLLKQRCSLLTNILFQYYFNMIIYMEPILKEGSQDSVVGIVHCYGPDNPEF
jgi:hypothetical protein